MPRGGVHDKDRFVLLQFATWQYFIKKPNRFIIIILYVYCNVVTGTVIFPVMELLCRRE